jgi:DNA-binding response OmpR family regulator
MARTKSIPSEKPPRALVLDADARAVHALRRSLEARSFAVSAATDGTAGLALLLDELLKLDVLVLDRFLPDRDARSFADLVRRAGGERDLAIVVLADAPDAALRAELLALGVDGVVDRSAGSDAAAEEALAAVHARTRADGDAPRPAPAPVRPAPAAHEPRWALIPARWTLLPA